MEDVMRNLIGIVAVFLLFSACGTDASGEDTGETSQYCTSAAAESDAAVSGVLYYDADESDRSAYAAEYKQGEDQPVAGNPIDLISANGVVFDTSCTDGSYAFNDLQEGVYVLAPDPVSASCLTKNCTRRFPQALLEGEVKIVTMGDSVATVGDAPLFPKRVKTLLSDLATIKSKNVAVGGSLSTQWLPGSPYFDDKLSPELSDADVLVMSIGGNDIVNSLDINALQDPEGTMEEIRVLIQEIADNVLTTAAKVKEINADIDILYCLYVNYGEASIFPWNVIANVAPEGAVAELMSGARDTIGADENIILVDLFGASATLENLDDYLQDALHFNDKGHTFYAEEIFKALGGVLIGESPLEGEPRSPLGTAQNWSFSE
jgi:lysophospholipase L1-like esterase